MDKVAWAIIGAPPVIVPNALQGAFKNLMPTAIRYVCKSEYLQKDAASIHLFQDFWGEMQCVIHFNIHKENIMCSLYGQGPLVFQMHCALNRY
jgi:hypothetical protein